MTKILFVCLGNICRSPLAEGVFRHHAVTEGSNKNFEIDSAGTGAWHIGDPPDPRMRTTAKRNGVSLEDLRARRFSANDYDRFDYIVAMDRNNMRDILAQARTDADHEKVVLFRDYDPYPDDGNVPDPYYGGDEGFDQVYDIVDRTVKNLIEQLSD